ncbi:MAG: TolC family protein [Afipia sp.]|nr:TolC family protein [Afipia sp.]
MEIDRQIIVSVLALATLPARSEIAAEKFRQAQLRVVWETLRIAADTRRAYYQAVAARELTEFLTQAQGAAETSAKLATRLGETGAMNKLDQAREQAFSAELAVQRATAYSAATSAREALIRAMGVWGSDLDFKLPNALPPLPKRVQALANIEVEAVRRRVDLQISRMEVDAIAKAYGLTQATRFINVLDAGYADKITKDKATGQRTKDRGFDVAFEIPIFDFGEVRVREAEATYMGSVNRLLQRAVNVRSEARDAYRSYRSTYDIANHYTREVLPLRKIVVDESQLRYNGMLIDVFDLLLEVRQRITVNTAAIAARREFWLASTNLTTAVVGGGSSGRAGIALATASASGAAGD